MQYITASLKTKGIKGKKKKKKNPQKSKEEWLKVDRGTF